jgi:hypothetical protein
MEGTLEQHVRGSTDLVVLLSEGEPLFAIVVEVQLSQDKDKRKTWPLYLTSLRSRVGCPTALLVVAPGAAVARWCAQPIELGHPGFVLRPLVIGPDAIPVITDEQAACRAPELAVLSAMAHGHEEVGQAIAQAVLTAVAGLEAGRVRLYIDLALSSLDDVARNALETLMQTGNYQYQSEFARKYVAQGEAAALLEVLDARGIEVDEAARQRLLACTDFSQLKGWLRKAVTVTSVEELFEGEPPSTPTTPKAGKLGRGTKPRGSPSER